MPAIRIRPARPADLDALFELESTSFNTDVISRRRLRHWITASNGILLVAMRGGELLGYVLMLTRRDSRFGRLYSLVTARHARGLGIGRRLLLKAKKLASGAGCQGIRLEVSDTNTVAIALYEKLGFERCGFKAGYYENGENAVRMRLLMP